MALLCLMITACRPTPPGQPPSGPGGSDYPFGEVQETIYGEDVLQYNIFEPSSPVPTSAPVVLFLHGWGCIDAIPYYGWIEHIVRKGSIVIYPRYQSTAFGDPADEIRQYVSNAILATKEAMTELQTGGHVAPELDRFALVGHSLGGFIAADMAAVYASEGLPEPKVLMVADPGRGEEIYGEPLLPEEAFGSIPSTVLLLSIAAAESLDQFYQTAREIFLDTGQIPLSNKDFIYMRSDDHGQPALVADHFSPTCSGGMLGENDALDYYGYWKLFDGLCSASFYGTNVEYALGGTAEQRFMGLWSDDEPVIELIATDDPPEEPDPGW